LCFALGVAAGLLGAGYNRVLFDPGASDPTAHAATFAVVGMAAFFTAVVRAPLTGIILVTEMTDNSRLLLPMRRPASRRWLWPQCFEALSRRHWACRQ
jgi:CIC family chloride channel protein